MKKVRIPDDGLEKYRTEADKTTTHILTLWGRDYWRENGQPCQFCEEARLIAENTEIDYYGHGNRWEEVYKKGEVVCTKKDKPNPEFCHLGQTLVAGCDYTATEGITATFSLDLEGRLVIVADNSFLKCKGEKELKFYNEK